MLTNPKTVDLIYILTALLVPIIPAVIFYRWFPSTAEVSSGQSGSGFLRGIGFKLGGAFGAYFIVMVVILKCRPPLPPLTGGEIWTVRGTFDSSPKILNEDEITLSIQPRAFLWNLDNSFTVDIYVPRKDGNLIFPTLNFGRSPQEKFQPATVHLDGAKYEIGKAYTTSTPAGKTREIQINEKIELPKLTSTYDGSGPAPAPVPSPKNQ
jgi:hypothetical protein